MRIKNFQLPAIFFALFLFALSFNSCKKDVDPLADLPETFTKKVLIEEFTAEWCAPCASAFANIQTVLDENPNTVYATTIHHNDPFSSNQTKAIKEAFSISSFPSSMVDRFAFGSTTPRIYPSTSTLRNRSEERMVETVTTGLKIETEILDDGKANITVYVGQSKIMSGTPRLTTYLLEDNVPQVNQAGTSDPDYKHHHVLREVLTSNLGNTFEGEINLRTQDRAYNTYVYENIDISNYDKNNLEVIAFVHTYDGTDLSNHEIINVQKVNLGENQDWD